MPDVSVALKDSCTFQRAGEWSLDSEPVCLALAGVQTDVPAPPFEAADRTSEETELELGMFCNPINMLMSTTVAFCQHFPACFWLNSTEAQLQVTKLCVLNWGQGKSLSSDYAVIPLNFTFLA